MKLKSKNNEFFALLMIFVSLMMIQGYSNDPSEGSNGEQPGEGEGGSYHVTVTGYGGSYLSYANAMDEAIVDLENGKRVVENSLPTGATIQWGKTNSADLSSLIKFVCKITQVGLVTMNHDDEAEVSDVEAILEEVDRKAKKRSRNRREKIME